MQNIVARVLLSISAAILALGGVMHAMAFHKTVTAVAGSNLEPYFAHSFLALWLIDSTTLVTLAGVFGLAVVSPRAVARAAVAVLAVIPAATAAILYAYLGAFLPAHVLLAAAVLAWTSALARDSGPE
jgi:hypothetical protein